MKKFLTVSMLALALVLASSCNKEENSGDNNAKYVGTWVAKDIPLAQIVGELGADGDLSEIISQLPEDTKATVLAKKFNVVMTLDENGKGTFGLHLDKNTHQLLYNIYSYFSEQGYQYPPAISELVAKIKDNDYAGMGFTYVAAPTDETKGKFTFTVKIKDDAETSIVDYSGLTDDAITLSYEDKNESGEPVNITYNLISLAKSGITVNNFIDLSVLASLIPDEEDTPETGK